MVAHLGVRADHATLCVTFTEYHYGYQEHQIAAVDTYTNKGHLPSTGLLPLHYYILINNG